ncbi:ABC transporter permease [Dehalobacterium formicoaceticum]|uniref:ABC transporter permease n=1 Tax=Dehalobacterium formicoaceticum TaxID=51515 RepID=A0ABT1Y651_9FIRM|nr:ABC transporter permease [Dehalobacterium formicoaceticum]MCR6545590.1 ABC transporter permease [Dehalobacterium formicoaceticum]
MDQLFMVTLLATAVTAGTPILLAALGEIITEKSGILNLGVEGMMLVGAVVGFMANVATQNPWLGVLMALIAGGLMALMHAFLTITLRGNQVVCGLALTIFGTGLSGFLGKSFVGIPAPASFKAFSVPLLGDLPLIGPIFFRQDALVYVSYLLVIVLALFLYKTRWGLSLRAVGENPAAADAVGISVFRIRYLSVIAGGMLAGLGGAYLSLAYAPSWLENMTAGRGWIAVALVIFATWNPVKCLVGSYIFGGLDALGFRIQTRGIDISPFFLQMLPYIATIIVLIFVSRETKTHRVSSPKALSIPYDREER